MDSNLAESRVVTQYAITQSAELLLRATMICEAMDAGVAPDGADVLLELVSADMRALLDLQRDRLWVLEMTAIFNRHLGHVEFDG